MSTVRILLEVASDGKRTPQELADIAAGRLTSCLGIDQRVPEPVRVLSAMIVGPDGFSEADYVMLSTGMPNPAQNRPRTSYDDLRNATPMEVLMQRTGHLNEPDAIKPTWWQRVLAWL